MDEGESRARAEAFIAVLRRVEAREEGAVEAITDLFTEEAHLESAALRLADEERRGREGVGEFWRSYQATLRSARSEFSAITVDAAAAGLFWRTTGEGANGQALAYDGASLLLFEADGRIGTFRSYYDTRQLDPVAAPVAATGAGDQETEPAGGA